MSSTCLAHDETSLRRAELTQPTDLYLVIDANPASRLRAKGGKPNARQTHMEKLKASRTSSALSAFSFPSTYIGSYRSGFPSSGARKEARKKRAESYDSLFDGSDDALKELEEEPEPVVHKSAYIINSDGSTSSSDATGVDTDEDGEEVVQLPGWSLFSFAEDLLPNAVLTRPLRDVSLRHVPTRTAD